MNSKSFAGSCVSMYPHGHFKTDLRNTVKPSALLLLLSLVEVGRFPQNTDPPRDPRVPPHPTPTFMTPAVSYKAHPWGQEVLFTQDEKTLKTLGTRHDLNLDREGTDGCCWTTKGPYVLWVRPGSPVPVLVHECTHATFGILAHVGIDPASSDNEPFCYTLQRMLEKFLPHLLPKDPVMG